MRRRVDASRQKVGILNLRELGAVDLRLDVSRLGDDEAETGLRVAVTWPRRERA
jgi:hypothetical protein